MSVLIGDDRMTSDQSPHVAVQSPDHESLWRVTFLAADRNLTRNQAITAMTLAEVVGSYDGEYGPHVRTWPHAEGWARELNYDLADLLNFVTSPPRWSPPGAPPSVPRVHP